MIMDSVYLVIGLALLEFFTFAMLVGMSRVKNKVDAPATTGNETHERYHRVHYNTMESLVVFIPAILMYAHYISAIWAAGIGVVYLVGRIVYFFGYIKDPAKRGMGYGITMLPLMILMLGGICGAGMAVIG
jgi:glutathione S-transferase